MLDFWDKHIGLVLAGAAVVLAPAAFRLIHGRGHLFRFLAGAIYLGLALYVAVESTEKLGPLAIGVMALSALAFWRLEEKITHSGVYSSLAVILVAMHSVADGVILASVENLSAAVTMAAHRAMFEGGLWQSFTRLRGKWFAWAMLGVNIAVFVLGYAAAHKLGLLAKGGEWAEAVIGGMFLHLALDLVYHGAKDLHGHK